MTQIERIKEEYLSEQEVMEFLGYSLKTVQNFRSIGSPKIPPAKKVGALWVYPVKDFKAWLERLPTVKSVV